MTKSLVIVDSITKGQTLKTLVDDHFDVFSLPSNVLSVIPSSRQDVTPGDEWKVESRLPQSTRNSINTLKSSMDQYRQVFVASNPDTRGEAFADFCAGEFGLANAKFKRIVLNEITGNSVLAKLKNPSPINSHEVNVYHARQIFENWVSSTILPDLALKRSYDDTSVLLSLLSLRVLCERENAIESFKPKTKYLIRAEFKIQGKNIFDAELISIKGKKPNISDKNVFKAIVIDLKDQDFTVKSITRKKFTIAPPSPFTTGSLLQDAEQQLGFSAQKAMSIAKQLYEGVDLGKRGSMGLITYYKSQDEWVPPQTIPEVREQILSDFGVMYLPQQGRTFPSITNGASEAIRPTDIKLTPRKVKKFLTDDQHKLYSLIWHRFIGSQMVDAEVEEFVLKIVTGDDDRYKFKANLATILFRGFAQAYENGHFLPVNGANYHAFENLNRDSKLQLVDIRAEKQQTQAPQRFTESSLLAFLQENGVDASENFDAVLSFLFENNYLERNDNELMPTPDAFDLIDRLILEHPDILSFDFVHRVGELLEQIGQGELSIIDFIDVACRESAPATRQIVKSGTKLKRHAGQTGQSCPLCGSDLIRQTGPAGTYLSCINYPYRCSYAKKVDEADNRKIDEKCDVCHREMVVRTGPYGRFLACSGFPECNFTRPYPISVRCPVPGCGGEIVEKMSKNGKLFYGCSHYPNCNFSSKFKPVNVECGQCKNSFLVIITDEDRGDFLRCPVCAAKYHLDLSHFNFNESLG